MSDAPDIITLQARLEAAESETIEQARLLGMSGEREAKHLARIEQLERECDRLAKRKAELTFELAKLALTDSGGDVFTGSTRRVDVSKNAPEIDKCAPIIDAAMSATGGAK